MLQEWFYYSRHSLHYLLYIDLSMKPQDIAFLSGLGHNQLSFRARVTFYRLFKKDLSGSVA